MFDALAISGTGMSVHQKWMDAHLRQHRQRQHRAPHQRDRLPGPLRRRAGGRGRRHRGRGVQVGGIELGSAEGRLVYDPDNPLADAKGYVRMPDIDLGEQMTTMIMAQRGYQANIANLDRVRATYQAAIQMGRG